MDATNEDTLQLLQKKSTMRNASLDRGSVGCPAGNGGVGQTSSTRRVHVANIPSEFGWFQLKDLFNHKVGDVVFVEMLDFPKNTALIKFKTPEAAKKAIEQMQGFCVELGCELLVKAYNYEEHQHHQHNEDIEDRSYGSNPEFLQSLDIKGPLVNKVFVSNLHFRVDCMKLQEVFSLAGSVVNTEIKTDHSGKSKGNGYVTFKDPIEAVKAIAMFNKTFLFNRPMLVRMDRYTIEKAGYFKNNLPDEMKHKQLPSAGLGQIPLGHADKIEIVQTHDVQKRKSEEEENKQNQEKCMMESDNEIDAQVGYYDDPNLVSGMLFVSVGCLVFYALDKLFNMFVS